jgi:predicted transcriptional regulator
MINKLSYEVKVGDTALARTEQGYALDIFDSDGGVVDTREGATIDITMREFISEKKDEMEKMREFINAMEDTVKGVLDIELKLNSISRTAADKMYKDIFGDRLVLDGDVVGAKPTKAEMEAARKKAVSAPTAPTKPKRKRRTKAEMEAARKAEDASKGKAPKKKRVRRTYAQIAADKKAAEEKAAKERAAAIKSGKRPLPQKVKADKPKAETPTKKVY